MTSVIKKCFIVWKRISFKVAGEHKNNVMHHAHKILRSVAYKKNRRLQFYLNIHNNNFIKDGQKL